jgi:hypothetical protein
MIDDILQEPFRRGSALSESVRESSPDRRRSCTSLDPAEVNEGNTTTTALSANVGSKPSLRRSRAMWVCLATSRRYSPTAPVASTAASPRWAGVNSPDSPCSNSEGVTGPSDLLDGSVPIPATSSLFPLPPAGCSSRPRLSTASPLSLSESFSWRAAVSFPSSRSRSSVDCCSLRRSFLVPVYFRVSKLHSSGSSVRSKPMFQKPRPQVVREPTVLLAREQASCLFHNELIWERQQFSMRVMAC